jgi:hypothetical protein
MMVGQLILKSNQLLFYRDFKGLVAFVAITGALVDEVWLQSVKIIVLASESNNMRCRNNLLTRVKDDTNNKRPVCSLICILVYFDLCHLD